MTPMALLAEFKAKGVPVLPVNKGKPIWICRLADIPA